MIKPKKKKCKGTGKCRDRGCGIETYNRRYGLCNSCFAKWLYQTPEGLEKVLKAQLKATKISSNINRKKNKELKDSIINWRDKLQTKIQEISRLIDVGLPCLARGYHPNQIHGGHVFAKGGNKTISLNLHNIHRQSAQSNHNQNDDGLLREGLINEYGKEYMDFISELRQCPSLNYSNIEYKDFYRLACKIALQLKREGNRFELKERIDARNRINKELEIYQYEFCVFKLENS